MNRQDLHDQLLKTIEAELVGAGCTLTNVNGELMARLLERIDEVRIRGESQVIEADWEDQLSTLDDDKEPRIRDPRIWLCAAECA